MQWIKDNAKWLIPVVSLVFGSLGAAIGVKFTVKTDPNATTPEINIVWPVSEKDSDPNFVLGAINAVERERSPVNPILTIRARRATVDALVKGGMDRAEARRRVNQIPESAVAQAVIEAGVPKDVYGAFGDGSFLKKIIEWLSDPANQERLVKIVEFLMKLAILFAQHADPNLWPTALAAWAA